jgi:hypothetical protein
MGLSAQSVVWGCGMCAASVEYAYAYAERPIINKHILGSTKLPIDNIHITTRKHST